MPTEEALKFRKPRDLGEVISATFAYLRQTWRSLGRALLYFVGPLLAVQLVVSSLYQSQLFSLMQPGGSDAPPTPDEVFALYGDLLGPFLLILPVSLLTATLAVTVVYEHMRLYRTHGPGAVQVADVWAGVKRTFGRMLGTMLVAFLSGALTLFVVMLVGGMLAGGLMAGAGPVGAALGVLLMLLGFVCAGAYLLVLFALLFPVRMYEDVGLGRAVRRCLRLLDGVFWQSLGVVFVVVLLYYVIATGFSMPASILGFVWGFNATDGGTLFQVSLVAANVVSGIGGMVAYCIPLVAAALYYFGLVEQQEHTGLAERVGQVGSTEHAEAGEAGAPKERAASYAPSEQAREEDSTRATPPEASAQGTTEGPSEQPERDDEARWSSE